MTERTSPATVGLVTIAVLFLLLVAVPLFMPSASAKSSSSPSCQVIWGGPSGNVLPGPETWTIQTSCGGKHYEGGYAIYSCTSPATSLAPCPGAVVLQFGGITCPAGGCPANTNVVTYNFVAPGYYEFEAGFSGQYQVYSFVVYNVNVTPEFPLGTLLAVVAPLIAYAGYGLARSRLRVSAASIR